MSRSLLLMLKDKGLSVSAIVSSLNVHRQSVCDSLNCQSNGSRRVRLYIASVIGRPPSLLFLALPLNVKILDDFEFMNNLLSSERVLPL
jgi:hypothetical protein